MHFQPTRIAISLTAMVLLAASAKYAPAIARVDDQAPPPPIQIEFKGQLSARGGGFQIRAQEILWQLDVSATPELRSIATRLDGQTAIVKGTVSRETARAPWILRATTIETAAANGRDEDDVAVTIAGTLRTGVMAIGAETTGTTITAGNVTWDLDVERRHRDTVNRLNGARAIVSGHLRRSRGVEVPGRLVIKVRTLRAG